MPAIARKRLGPRWLLCLPGLIVLLGPGLNLRADQSGEIRSEISDTASALSAGNAADAIAHFSKAFPNYVKLRNYFSGLTNAFEIVNEVDIVDQQDTEKEAAATVRWAITLSHAQTGSQTGYSVQRSAEIAVRFAREKGKWKIVAFDPIDIFDPAQAQTPTAPPGY